MNRAEMIGKVHERSEPWDIVVVGGGATGDGIAVDAASRGYDVLLLEQHDAEDAVNQAATLAHLPERTCKTATLNIHGFHPHAEKFGALGVYGSDALAISDLMRAHPPLAQPLHAALRYRRAEVMWAVRVQMAQTVEDVPARRTRALCLNAAAAIDMAPEVAHLMAVELGHDDAWERREVAAFTALAQHYRLA